MLKNILFYEKLRTRKYKISEVLLYIHKCNKDFLLYFH